MYQLEDGTGRIVAREWLSDIHNISYIGPSQTEGRFVHRYVRVRGLIDQFGGGAKSVKVSFMRECPDPHEPYFHFLECCMVTMVQKTGTLVSPYFQAVNPCLTLLLIAPKKTHKGISNTPCHPDQ